MTGIPRFERRIKIRGAKLFSITTLHPPIADHPLELADTEIWNRDGFYSSTQPTRVTVPTGYAGVYSVHSVVQWGIGLLADRFRPEIRDGSYFITQLAKNGSVADDLNEARAFDPPTIPTRICRQDVFWEADLEDNSYIEVLVSNQAFDQSVMDQYDILYGAAWFYRLEHWLTIRRLGRLP